MARLLTQAEVISITGLPRTSIWRYRQAGTFPEPVKVGSCNVLFRSAEISTWMFENRGQKIHFD